MTKSTQEERAQVQQGWLVSPSVIERMANDADRLAQAEELLREARTVISMAANDADEIRRIKSGPNAAAAMQRRDKAWAVEAKIDRILDD